MSGRALRRLPVLALARYIGIGNLAFSQTAQSTTGGSSSRPQNGAPVEIWLDGMEKTVREQAKELEKLI